jgi:uncharacterized SAM-binding protein YcdF (DUF218 family)
MFALKQFLKSCVLPPGFWLILLLAVFFFWKRHWARKLLLVSGILIFLFHNGIVASGLLWPLESRYKLLQDPHSAAPYDAIVTLTAGMTPPGGLIQFPRISEPQYHRLAEVFRLYKIDPKPVIVSGGHVDPFTPTEGENRMTCDFLVGMGVPRAHVIAEPKSRDTYESAVEVRKIMEKNGWRRYLLVTSASHMPRSMLVFSRIAPEPVPAPGDFTIRRFVWSPLRLLSDENSAKDIGAAMNEYVGLVNYWLRLRYE